MTDSQPKEHKPVEKQRILEKLTNTPSRVTEMQVGNTLFTVISVQSKCAKETAYEKVKRMILEHASKAGENVSECSNIPAR